jgi:hypothetical protein
MGLFDVFRKKPADPQSVDRELAQKLVHLVMNMLRDKDGRIHTEDAISACATIVAERCIDAAGIFRCAITTWRRAAACFPIKQIS